ncbi:hypothetical protein ABZP36_021701 [Zizania latifolia]
MAHREEHSSRAALVVNGSSNRRNCNGSQQIKPRILQAHTHKNLPVFQDGAQGLLPYIFGTPPSLLHPFCSDLECRFLGCSERAFEGIHWERWDLWGVFVGVLGLP